MSPDLSWTLSPGVLIGAAACWWFTCAAGGRCAAAARRVPRPRRPVWRLCCFVGSMLVDAGGADLARRRARRPAVLHHMAQHVLLLDARPDPRDPRLHEGDPAPRHPRRPRPRAQSRAARSSGLRGGPLRRGDLGLARPGGLRPRRAPRARPRPRAPHLHHRRLAVLVAPALADPRADAPRRDGPDRLHGLHRSCSWARSAWASPSHRPPSTPTTSTSARVWGISAGDDQSHRRAGHGPRAVAGDGHRDRRAVRARADRVRAEPSSAASATNWPDQGRSPDSSTQSRSSSCCTSGLAAGLGVRERSAQLLPPGADDLVGHRHAGGRQARLLALPLDQTALVQLGFDDRDPLLLDLLEMGHRDGAGDAVAVEPGQRPDRPRAQLHACAGCDALADLPPPLAAGEDAQRAVHLRQRAVRLGRGERVLEPRAGGGGGAKRALGQEQAEHEAAGADRRGDDEHGMQGMHVGVLVGRCAPRPAGPAAAPR